MIRNATVTILRRVETGQGAYGLSQVGTYNCYVELSPVSVRRITNAFWEDARVPKGFMIMFDDIDLNDCFVQLNNEQYQVVHVDRFLNPKGTFHHLEVYFDN